MVTWQKVGRSDIGSALGRDKLGYAKFMPIFDTDEIASASSDIDIYLFIHS